MHSTPKHTQGGGVTVQYYLSPLTDSSKQQVLKFVFRAHTEQIWFYGSRR